MSFLIRLLLNGCAILVAAWLVPGLHLSDAMAALFAGAILGFVNALVRPVLLFFTLPLTLVTLGLFIFVVNALCLSLTAWIVPGFSLDGFWWAMVGAVVVSMVSWVLNGVFHASRR